MSVKFLSRLFKAIEAGSDRALIELLADKLQEGLRKHFKKAIDKKKFAPDDLTEGRDYVGDYVTYIHYVERLYEAAEQSVVVVVTTMRIEG